MAILHLNAKANKCNTAKAKQVNLQVKFTPSIVSVSFAVYTIVSSTAGVIMLICSYYVPQGNLFVHLAKGRVLPRLDYVVIALN